MIRDEDLKSSIDYSEGQKRAAHRVLVELVNVFREYEDEIRVVGGWVPDLMFPEEGHVGSVDVDIMINHLTLQDEGYQNMSRILHYQIRNYCYNTDIRNIYCAIWSFCLHTNLL